MPYIDQQELLTISRGRGLLCLGGFSVAASILRNSMPPDIQSPASLADFCHN